MLDDKINHPNVTANICVEKRGKFQYCQPIYAIYPIILIIMAEHNETGKTGEALAVSFLEKQGLDVLHTNYRDGKNEVDIIASKDSTLHFIEVKTKSGQGLGQPESRVNQAKISRMKRVAENYCYQNPVWKSIQFDILSITMQQGHKEEYFWIEDVF